MSKRKNISFLNMNDIDHSIQAFAQQARLAIENYSVLQIYQRPFSTVIKIQIRFKNGSVKNYYLKFYQREAKENKPQIVERDFYTTQFWYVQFSAHSKFNVIKPVYFDKTKFILITEESKGRNLIEIINKYGQFFPSQIVQRNLKAMLILVGKWLWYFQNIPIEDKYGELNLDYFIDYVEIRLNRLVENKKINFDPSLKSAVIKFIRNRWAEVNEKDIQYCYVHSDLSLSNILIHNHSITVLDFSKRETGLIYKDLTRLYHQLALLLNKPTFEKSFVKKLQKALLEGYGMPDAPQKPLFRIYYLIHMLNHLNKNSRYWEHGFVENLYNRWVVNRTMKHLKIFLEHELQTKN